MKISYTNFKKEFPSVRDGKAVFNSWLQVNRYWGGKLVTIGVKHHQLTIDFRGDLFEELTGKKRQS